MKRHVGIAAVGCSIVFIGLLSSGCWLRSFVSQSNLIVTYEYDEYVEALVNAALEDSTVTVCVDDEHFGYECQYFIGGYRITSTFDLVGEFGELGFLIDPLILQVPAGLPAFTASYDLGSGFVPLTVTTVTDFQVQPDVSVTAEPGKKFLIFELPQSAEAAIAAADPEEGKPIKFRFDWHPSSAEPIGIKAMFTARVVADGVTYYLPLLPCVTDFADVPALDIPIVVGTHDLLSAAEGLAGEYAELACDGKVYDLRTDVEEPEPEYPFRLVVPGVAVDSKIE